MIRVCWSTVSPQSKEPLGYPGASLRAWSPVSVSFSIISNLLNEPRAD